jgi:flagellar protein FliO/FliZ
MRHNVVKKSINTVKNTTTAGVLFIFFLCTVLCPIAAISQERKGGEKKDVAVEKTAEKKGAGDEEKKSAREDGGEREEAAKARGEKGLKKEEGILSKEYEEDEFKPKVEDDSYGWMVFKTILVLAALVGGFYYFFRFVTKKTGMQILGGEAARILSVVPLGQNKYLQVVDLAGKILVLGVSDNNINLISEVTEKDEIDRIRILSSRRPPEVKGFQEYITKQIGKIINRVTEVRGRDKKFGSGSGSGIRDTDMDYLKQQRNRLKDLNGINDE